MCQLGGGYLFAEEGVYISELRLGIGKDSLWPQPKHVSQVGLLRMDAADVRTRVPADLKEAFCFATQPERRIRLVKFLCILRRRITPVGCAHCMQAISSVGTQMFSRMQRAWAAFGCMHVALQKQSFCTAPRLGIQGVRIS